MKRIYLDNASGTKIDSKVKQAMTPFLGEQFSNPSAIYKEGTITKSAVEVARDVVATTIGARNSEIIFTSGGTESNNLAIFGVVKSYRKLNKNIRPHIVTSSIEHSSVIETCKSLEENGVDVTYVKVDEEGFVNPKDVRNAISENTILVSVISASNEIGSIQPVSDISKIVRVKRKEYKSDYPYIHTDACQAVNYLDVNVMSLGIDLLTLNSAKIYGPKGSGVLFIKKGTKIEPIIYGGGQEIGLRSGTENVPAIVGLGEAIKITNKIKESEAKRLLDMQSYFINGLLSKIPGSILNGPLSGLKNRLPNNVNISVPNVDSEQLVIELDAKGISASAASSCQSPLGKPSYVIIALEESGRDHFSGQGSVRFSMGRETKKEDLEYVLEVMPKIVEKIANKLI